MDKNQPDAILSLHQAGFCCRSDRASRQGRSDFTFETEDALRFRGRPDTLALRGALGCGIEFKQDHLSFKLDAWREDQRRAAHFYVTELHVDYFLWITLYGDGVHPVNRPADWLPPRFVVTGKAKSEREQKQLSAKQDRLRLLYRPTRTWLIPYHEFLYQEQRFLEAQRAHTDTPLRLIPYRASVSRDRVLTATGLDMTSLFSTFELQWSGSHCWSIPKEHCFYQAYILPDVSLVYTRERAAARHKGGDTHENFAVCPGAA